MLAQKERAAASTTAPNQNPLNQAYDHPQGQSSKILDQTAALLLYLQTPLSEGEQRKCWRAFESKLQQYVGLRNYGGKDDEQPLT